LKESRVKSSKKAVIIVLMIGISLFGYFQFVSASQIGVIITESYIFEESELGSSYNVQLEFDNPSVLMLTAGETDFSVYVNDKKLGDGKLEPFVLHALGKTTVDGIFLSNVDLETTNDVKEVKISGVTTYDVLFTSIDVPFVYYPPDEQAREFIRQN